MLDIKFVRENPDIVKENIRKKFQNAKLPLVDEAIALDAQRRQAIADGEALKADRNKLSKANGPLFGKLKKCTDEAEKAAIQAQIDANNAAVKSDADRMGTLEAQKEQAEAARELGERLGRPCKIVTGKKKGRIELEYFGMDDLNALLEALHQLKH